MKYLEGLDFIREKVRVRDNHSCQICFKKWEQGQRRFDVHHLNPELESNREYKNSKCFDEMITLCHKCHLNLEHIKNKRRVSSETISIIREAINHRMTYEQMGKILGCTRQNVQQLDKKYNQLSTASFGLDKARNDIVPAY